MIMFGVSLLVLLIYLIFWVLSFKNDMDMESMSAYECGFESGWMSRFSFSYRFFLISILFIIFDVEVSLMLPVPFVKGISGGGFFFIFIGVLIVGLLYEYSCGVLDWLGGSFSKA